MLSYVSGTWEWSKPKVSKFNARIGQAEGACGYNPVTDSYVLKEDYTQPAPYGVFDKNTGVKISSFPSFSICVCIDFDLKGNYYLANWYGGYFTKYSADHKLIWKVNHFGNFYASGITYRRTDHLIYTCEMGGPFIQVLNPDTGERLKTLAIKGQIPCGQWHPLKCIPMEVDGYLEEILVIDNNAAMVDSPDKGGLCYKVEEDCVRFIKVFNIPLPGYLNYIYEPNKLLVSQCESAHWLEYEFDM